MPAINDYWPLVLANLKDRVTTDNFRAWFSRMEFVKTSNQGRKITLSVPSRFNKNYIQTKFKPQLMESLSKYYPQAIHLDLVVNTPKTTENEVKQQVLAHIDDEQPVTEKAKKPQSQNVNKILTQKSKPSYLPKENLNNLNPRYTFETFVVTGNTELVHNVAKAVSEKPGQSYNPVYIYGGVGLGKTHLMQAVGHKALENFPSLNIKYIPCETFITQFQLAVRNHQMSKFKDYYRSIELLLIDDIQFLSGKEATQEEFFHTFNILQQANKQIILTSDQPPNEIKGLEERLSSRFAMGMVVDISKPDLEARIAILTDKVARMKLNLPDHQIHAIAQAVDTNIRDLEGVLNKIQAKLTFSLQSTLDDSTLSQILDVTEPASSVKIEYLSNPGQTQTYKITSNVCSYFGLNYDEVLGSSRQKDISMARQITMYLLKTELGMSYPAIGKIFGGRDHSTVIHAINKITKLSKRDTKLRQKIKIIKNTALKK